MHKRATVMQLAAELVRSLEGCPGVAGLDPASRYVTTGVDAMHRGLRIRSGDDDTTHVELELVGLDGAVLPDAGTVARALVVATLVRHGHRPGDVTIRFTDIVARPFRDDGDRSDPNAGAIQADEDDVTDGPAMPLAAAIPVESIARTEVPLSDAKGTPRVRVTVEVVEPGR